MKVIRTCRRIRRILAWRFFLRNKRRHSLIISFQQKWIQISWMALIRIRSRHQQWSLYHHRWISFLIISYRRSLTCPFIPFKLRLTSFLSLICRCWLSCKCRKCKHSCTLIDCWWNWFPCQWIICPCILPLLISWSCRSCTCRWLKHHRWLLLHILILVINRMEITSLFLVFCIHFLCMSLIHIQSRSLQQLLIP